MAKKNTNDTQRLVVETLDAFDRRSGNWLERFVFNNRFWILVACAITTIVLATFAVKLRVTASYEGVMPQSQAFIKNYVAYRKQLHGLGNAVRIVVENTQGDIYQSQYLRTLQKINNKVYLMPGVDRSFMKSLWLPVVRWTEITPEGYKGGPVMPDEVGATGPISSADIAKLRRNVNRADLVGSLVADDQRSTMLYVPLIDKDPQTGKPINYADFHAQMQSLNAFESDGVKIHVIGFAQLMGDLIHAVKQVLDTFCLQH